jgi:hypothetical protein
MINSAYGSSGASGEVEARGSVVGKVGKKQLREGYAIWLKLDAGLV